MRRWSARALLGLVAVALCSTSLPAGAAEQAWVRGAPLNLRSGAGTQYRILGTLKPGEGIEILERAERWTRVRTEDGKDGWISAGYLDPEAPPARRVTQLESELSRARARLEATTAEAERLTTRSDELASTDEDQRTRIERLSKENAKLRAGERWAEWITGALILSLGMVAGAILSRVQGRRSSRRLRL